MHAGLASYVAHGAFHDSSVRYPPPKCHPGTREKVLTRIKDWIKADEGITRILWLYGSAGAGKSVIAQTIAEHGRTTDKLGAAFFFFRGDPQRNDANRLFPTLTWQLLFFVPEIKAHITASMEKVPFLPTRSISTQFEQLIVKRFQLAAQVAAQDAAKAVVQAVAPVMAQAAVQAAARAATQGAAQGTTQAVTQRAAQTVAQTVARMRLRIWLRVRLVLWLKLRLRLAS